MPTAQKISFLRSIDSLSPIDFFLLAALPQRSSHFSYNVIIGTAQLLLFPNSIFTLFICLSFGCDRIEKVLYAYKKQHTQIVLCSFMHGPWTFNWNFGRSPCEKNFTRFSHQHNRFWVKRGQRKQDGMRTVLFILCTKENDLLSFVFTSCTRPNWSTNATDRRYYSARVQQYQQNNYTKNRSDGAGRTWKGWEGGKRTHTRRPNDWRCVRMCTKAIQEKTQRTTTKILTRSHTCNTEYE